MCVFIATHDSVNSAWCGAELGAFWGAGTPADFPPDLLTRMGIAFVIGLILLILCQRGFARLQGNFAQEL